MDHVPEAKTEQRSADWRRRARERQARRNPAMTREQKRDLSVRGEPLGLMLGATEGISAEHARARELLRLRNAGRKARKKASKEKAASKRAQKA